MSEPGEFLMAGQSYLTGQALLNYSTGILANELRIFEGYLRTLEGEKSEYLKGVFFSGLLHISYLISLIITIPPIFYLDICSFCSIISNWILLALEERGSKFQISDTGLLVRKGEGEAANF